MTEVDAIVGWCGLATLIAGFCTLGAIAIAEIRSDGPQAPGRGFEGDEVRPGSISSDSNASDDA